MQDFAPINRDLVRSSVLDVEHFLSKHGNEQVLKSFEIVKNAIAALDSSRLNYNIYKTPVQSTLTLDSLIAKPADEEVPVASGSLLTFVSNIASRVASGAKSTLCSPLETCDKAEINVCGLNGKTECPWPCSSNQEDLPTLAHGTAKGWSIGPSRRRVVITDDTEEMYEKYMSQLGRNWNLDLLAVSNFRCVLRDGPIYCVGAALFKNVGPRIHPDFNKLVLPVLKGLQDVYLPNPYHNALHGATVGHMSVILASCIGAGKRFKPYEEVGFIMAALGHDAGHPGRTNAFLSQTGNPLALIYNDNSVLENYHASLMFHIVRSHREFYQLFTTEQWEHMRKRMIQLVLATDMKLHFNHVNIVKGRRCSGEFNMDVEDDFWLALVLCIKAADIGHNFLPWVDHLPWTSVLFEEFYLQGDEEQMLSLPLLMLFDRSRAADIPDSQLGFFQSFTKPMLEELIYWDQTPDHYIERIVMHNAMCNLEKWERCSSRPIPDILAELKDTGEEIEEAHVSV